MKSVSGYGSLASSQGGVPALPGTVWDERVHAPGFVSRLSSWTQGPLYSGDDLPGVPLDCFTSAMIDDGSDPSWVLYEHAGCEPVPEPDPMSDEELGGAMMEVDDDPREHGSCDNCDEE